MDGGLINKGCSICSSVAQCVHPDTLQQVDAVTLLPESTLEAHQVEDLESYFQNCYDISPCAWTPPAPDEVETISPDLIETCCKHFAWQPSMTTDHDNITALDPTRKLSDGSNLRFRNIFAYPRNGSSESSVETSSSRHPAEVQSECLIRKEKRREQNRRAQNAYRKRKEQQVWELEAEIAQLRNSYQQTQVDCVALVEELDNLKAVLEGVVSNLGASAKAVGLNALASLDEAYMMTQGSISTLSSS